MSAWLRFRLVFIISFISVVLDQLSKVWADRYLTHFAMNSYLSDTVRIGYVENHGAFLGLGSGLSEGLRFWIFVVAVGVVLGALLVYMFKSQQQNVYSLVCLSLIFSGGISNFYDRAMNNGAVIDFLNIGIGSLRTGIFNIADVAIMLGVFMLLFAKTDNGSTDKQA
ncbi:MAG: signal peptidase II [Paraglaciecola sp.]|uniref:signal peptidase II n=1 Tax=Pseudomonadati TaxID=3379134 RepID=UPI00273DA411|nr:signal peptidase II [Paraglaciecola sp.]MDP5031333.1 signal peptidase II [Paraglaciecola sp.]MDP5132338.1 signal peptidase II [Paraglaciecola sp.]